MEWEANGEEGDEGGGQPCEVMQNFVHAKHDIRDALCGIIPYFLCILVIYFCFMFSQNYLNLILTYGRIYGLVSHPIYFTCK